VRSHLDTRGAHAAHAHVHPTVLRAAAGRPPDASLFEAVIVFENIPPVADDPQLDGLRFETRTANPLVLVAWPDRRFRLELHADATRFGGVWLEERLAFVLGALERLARDPAVRVDACLPAPAIPDEGRARLVELEI
jgi:hypothetical protein